MQCFDLSLVKANLTYIRSNNESNNDQVTTSSRKRYSFSSLKAKVALTLPWVTPKFKNSCFTLKIFFKKILFYYFLLSHICYYKSVHIFIKPPGTLILIGLMVRQWIYRANATCSNPPGVAYYNLSRNKSINFLYINSKTH